MYYLDRDDFADNEMEQMLLEAPEMFATKFKMRWEPKSTDLQGLLDSYTKDQLITLSDQNGVDARKSWNKSKLVHSLVSQILGTLEERILLFEPANLKLFLKFLNKKSGIDSKEEKMDFYMDVFPQMVQLGLLFIREEQENIYTYVPLELLDLIRTLKEKRKDPEIQARIEFGNKLKTVLKASLHLYGVTTYGRIIQLWETKYSFEEDLLEFYKKFYEILPILIIQEGHSLLHDFLIASSEFDSDLEAMSLYMSTKEKMENDYYRPNASEITYYANYPFDRRSTSYKKLRGEIERLSESPDFAMDIIETFLVQGGRLSAVMEELEEFEEIIFDSQEHIEKFARAYTEMNNHTRLWENAGYTPIELRSQSVSDESIFSTTFSENKPKRPITQVNKIGRNDVCPCGSGKKYKKCCLHK